MQDSTYVMAQIAIAFHNMRQVDQAVEYFKQLSEVDPFRYRSLFLIPFPQWWILINLIQIRPRVQAFLVNLYLDQDPGFCLMTKI